MKFVSLFATISLLVPATEGASFVPALHENEGHEMDGLRRLKIAMHGLRGEPTESDLQVVKDALIKAFNQAYSAQGEYIMSDFVATSFNLIPDDDAGFRGLKDGHEGFGLIYGWANVPHQRSISEIIGGETISPFADMTAVEDLFCKFVAEDGGPPFSNVHDCRLYPMKQDVRAIIDDLKTKEDKKRDDSSAYNIEISIPGLTLDGKDRKKEWFSVWGDDLIAAYDEVHRGRDNYLSDFVATGFKIDDDYDNLRAGLQGSRGTLSGTSWMNCRYCRRSADSKLELSKVPFDDIEKVEKVFCTSVANTKGMGLDKVHDCKIKVVDAVNVEDKVASA